MEQQLEEYRTRLAQVNTVLPRLDPQSTDYETYTKLAQDIQNAIELTEHLLQMQQQQQPQPQPQSDEQPTSSSVLQTTSSSQSTTIATTVATATTEAKSNSYSTTHKSVSPKFNVGDYVYGLYEGLWYVAKVNQVIVPNREVFENNSDNDGSRHVSYHVTYVGYGNSDILQVEKWNIKKYEHVPLEHYRPGAKVYAVMTTMTDQQQQNNVHVGMFHEAVIDSVNASKETCWVTFRSSVQSNSCHNIVQEVPFPLIRIKFNEQEIYQPKYSISSSKSSKVKKPYSSQTAKVITTTTTSAAAVHEVNGHATSTTAVPGTVTTVTTGITVGQKRKEAPSGICDTGTAAPSSATSQQQQPPAKKKKKGPRKPSKAEEELQKRHNSWQSFMNKADKGQKGMTMMKRESMFKSPSTIQGKVGVSSSSTATSATSATSSATSSTSNQFKPLLAKSSSSSSSTTSK